MIIWNENASIPVMLLEMSRVTIVSTTSSGDRTVLSLSQLTVRSLDAEAGVQLLVARCKVMSAFPRFFT